MPSWLRLLLAAIGLSAAVYAGASLTGGWLGEPPWASTVDLIGRSSWRVAREGWEWISAAVLVAGLALFAWAAWPARIRRPGPA